MLLSPHSKWRVHSTYSNQPWLQEVNGGRPEVLIHPKDAEPRGIGHGDVVEVFNSARVTEGWARVTDRRDPGRSTCTRGGGAATTSRATA